jgi:hypothetical protein
MIKDLLMIVFLQLCILAGSFLAPAATMASSATLTPQKVARFEVREPNVYAPHLYADRIDFLATLVSLPGASRKQSYWELSYQLYFIPEDKYYEALRRMPRGPSNPAPEEFRGRILLAEGHKKKMRVSTLKERTINLTGVPFKGKVPDAQQTKFAVLMTAYSVKIFDAELNTTAYCSGIFLTEPYQENADDEAIPRKTIYLKFGLMPDGTLNYSQLPPRARLTRSR